MADEASLANGSAPAGPQLSLQKVYLKDASFEVPGAPHIFQEQGSAADSAKFVATSRIARRERLRSGSDSHCHVQDCG